MTESMAQKILHTSSRSSSSTMDSSSPLALESIISKVEQVSIQEKENFVRTDSDLEEEEEKEFLEEEEDEGNSIMDARGPTPNMLYWSKIRSQFMNSNWYRQVNEILEPTSDFQALGAKPAEVFFNTAMEVYLTSKNSEEFLRDLKRQLESSWDPRLEKPAIVFFSTAKKATSIVGVRGFLNGAIQLGMSTLNSALITLNKHGVQLLDFAEDTVDYFLPEHQQPQPHQPMFLLEEEEETKLENLPELANPCELDTSGCSQVAKDQRKRRRSVVDIAQTVSRRVRQRMPTIDIILKPLKFKLFSGSWFVQVDEILSQNLLLRSFGTLVRPAEHFFETSLNVFLERKRTLDEFVFALRTRLGISWDERLIIPASEFYESAVETSDAEIDYNFTFTEN